MPGRIEFVILRTDRSPPVASHTSSRRRGYVQLQAGERIPGEDSHLSVSVRFQAHSHGQGPGIRCVLKMSHGVAKEGLGIFRTYRAHDVHTDNPGRCPGLDSAAAPRL